VIKRRARILATILCGIGLATAGDKGFSPPPAAAASTYPAHETHDDENVTIAIDPYDTPEKAAIFKIKYRDIDFLPIRLIITNDGSTPIMLNDLKVEYITVNRDKIEPATREDIVRRIAHPQKAGTRAPVPFPVPRKKPDPIKQDQREEVESAAFVTFPVTPHSTYSGFLFFDIRDVPDPKIGAHIYLSGLKAGTKELFYFDIPLEKYPNNQPVK
jgi:hypothetical protein